MRAKQRAVRVARYVQNAEAATARGGAHLQTVGAHRARRHRRLVLGFQEKVGEIRGPHAKKLVIRRRHREPFGDAQVVDFAVVELEHALELPLAVVDLNHGAGDRGAE